MEVFGAASLVLASTSTTASQAALSGLPCGELLGGVLVPATGAPGTPALPIGERVASSIPTGRIGAARRQVLNRCS